MKPQIVVNTRPSSQARELSHLLREAGFEPLEAPAIEIVPVVPPNLILTLERLRAGEYAWLILPSANAGRFFPELRGAPVVCGSATAAALGIADASTLDHFNAAAALEWLEPRLRAGDRVLMPRAAEGRDELELGLREIGVEVDAPICYRTVAVSPATLSGLEHGIRMGEIAAITFCSPSAVRAVNLDLASVPIVCLGQTTATAARERGLRVSAVAPATTMSALVTLVRSVLGGVPA